MVTALAQLSIADYEAADDYNNGRIPQYTGHLGVLTDCDSSGVLIGLKIPGATKIGLDLNSIIEMVKFNKRLGIDLTDKLTTSNLVESTRKNSHWAGLNGIIERNKRSNAYQDILNYGASEGVEECRDYLLQDAYPDMIGRDMDVLDDEYYTYDSIPFIEWLETNRIELNTVLAIAKPAAFWNWLQFKLLELWPDRNYNRVFYKPGPSDVYTTAIKNFVTRLDNTFKPLIDTRYEPIEKQLNSINGFIKDTDGTEKLIHSRMSKQIATDEKIKLIGDRLEALANESNLEQS